jgi:hypothetical protein
MGSQGLTSVLGLSLAVLCALPAGAQNASVERANYTFLGSKLAIHVEAEVPGELQVIRGRSGRLGVRAVSWGGLAAFGLQDRGTARLNLTGLGGEEVSYLVVVPTRARVTVWLPDREAPEGLATLESSAVFRWEPPPTEGR